MERWAGAGAGLEQELDVIPCLVLEGVLVSVDKEGGLGVGVGGFCSRGAQIEAVAALKPRTNIAITARSLFDGGTKGGARAGASMTEG